MTHPARTNILTSDPRKQTPGGRHQIGTPAGFKSESVAGFISECLAGFVGIRKKAASLMSDLYPDEEFCRRLEMDGFVIIDGKIRATLPNDVGLPAVQDELHRLLTKHNFSTASGHLDQALDAHANGHWASANSQIRTFFDALFDALCERIAPHTKTLGSGHPRRTQLAAAGFLSRDLNEWGDNGLGFVNGLAKRLHPQGSHPGLSDPDDSTFRLHIVLLTARFFLRRFDTWGAP